MIRRAVSCDICGAICGMEKAQVNRWFVACDEGGELRVGGWFSANRLSPESKHLCGQTCLHKMVDNFMAQTLTARVPGENWDSAEASQCVAGFDASLTSETAHAAGPLPLAMETPGGGDSLRLVVNGGFARGRNRDSWESGTPGA